MRQFVQAHTFEVALIGAGLGSFAFALRAKLMSWGEDPNSGRRGERALARYAAAILPTIILGVVLIAIGLGILLIRWVMAR